LGPTHGRASLTLARLHRQSAQHHHLDYIARQLSRVESGSEDHAAFEFAHYKELEDLGRFDEAWSALLRGNAVMAARNPHDAALEQRLFARLRQHCTPAFLAELASDNGTTPQPIFVLGLPRSGTTLLERLLGKHAAIAAPGELPDFPRQLRWCADVHGASLLDERVLDRLDVIDYAQLGSATWRRRSGTPAPAAYVDKLPSNYMLAGLIHKALPRAPILHLVRAPLDVCFSNFRALFGDAHNYSYSLDDMAVHYRRYRALMAHWHAAMPGVILDVDYA
ncbi:TPR repeat-containing protein, partial [mine drainage metagenome]